MLQVFVGNDAGRVKPHGFYQACRVTGRNTTACKEVDIEGTTVIEVSLDPSNNMTLAYVSAYCHSCCNSVKSHILETAPLSRPPMGVCWGLLQQ